MTEFAAFGNPSRFEIAVRWTDDPEPRERRPAHGGWSTGEVRLTVGGHNLTHNRRGTANQEAAHWYLLPLFEWLAKNWVSLLHEERFGWQENSAEPSISTTQMDKRPTSRSKTGGPGMPYEPLTPAHYIPTSVSGDMGTTSRYPGLPGNPFSHRTAFSSH